MKILHTADWHIGQFKGPVVDGVNLRSQDTVKCLEYGHVCASCAALEGTKIGMDDEFKTVSGRREITTSIPPLHPRCKCAVKYVRVKNENIQ